MFLSLHILGNIFEIYFIQKQIVDVLLLHYSCLWGFLPPPQHHYTVSYLVVLEQREVYDFFF